MGILMITYQGIDKKIQFQDGSLRLVEKIMEKIIGFELESYYLSPDLSPVDHFCGVFSLWIIQNQHVFLFIYTCIYVYSNVEEHVNLQTILIC